MEPVSSVFNMMSLSVKFFRAYLLIHDRRKYLLKRSLPRGNNKVNHNSFKLVLSDLVGVDMVGGVDGPSFDSVRCLSGFQVDDVDQRFGAVPVPFHTLEKIILVRRKFVRTN